MALFSFLSSSGESATANELKIIMNEKNPKHKFVDVRTREEFKGGHIEGFVNIPLSHLADSLSKIPKHKTVYVLCASGARSNQAQKILLNHDRKVINVKGGMAAYSRL